MTEKALGLSTRIFHALLRLLPVDFRGAYAREMEDVFEAQQAQAAREGSVSVLRLWWDTLTGIFTTAPREHWEMLKQDTRYALRMMRRNPGFAVAAVLALALGIGANTAIFSVVYGVLIRPLPYGDGDRLVRIHQEAKLRNANNIGFSEKEENDYRHQNHTLADLVEYHNMNFVLLGGEEPIRINTGVVSPGFFSMFGVQPILGRDFRTDDDKPGVEGTLLLSYRFWEDQFHGDRNIIGRKFQMNDRPHVVIGVLPPLPLYPDENDVYMPVSSCPFRSSPQTREARNGRMVQLFARMKPGATLDQVRSDMAVIASRLEAEYPADYPKSFGFTSSGDLLREEMTSGARQPFLVLLATSGFVLLIACANVANLTLSRLLRRERELAVRGALGAGRVRLLRQMLTESALLALAGGALGLLLAAAGSELLVRFAARFTPRAGEVSLDFSVLIFTLVISMLAGLIFGALPAQFTARKMVDALREGGRSSGSHARSRMRNALVVAQVAFSIVLLVGAGLMLRSFVKLISVPPGFNPENVLTARLTLNFSKFNTNESIRGFYNRLLTKLDGRPEIKAKGVLSTIPLATGTGRFTSRFQIEGRMIADRAQQPVLDQRVASPGYFQAVGQPLVHGRLFNDFDNEKSTQVALINQSLARRHWSKDDPVGKRFTLDNGDHWVTIVGVVGDVKQYGLDREVVDEAYIPLAQGPFANSIFIRTAGDPMQLARFLRQTVYEVDSTVPIDRVRTLEAVKTESVAMPRLTAALMGMFAGLALLITATGIAGVMALSVSQRTHEIGIRMALGATPGNVLRMILGQGLLVTGVGAIAGLAGAAALTGLMRTLLFGVEPTDPVTFGGVALLLLLSATLACAMPARRAALIQPIQALHVE